MRNIINVILSHMTTVKYVIVFNTHTENFLYMCFLYKTSFYETLEPNTNDMFENIYYSGIFA